MKHYDYIFAGTGLASLMTVYEMIISDKFTNKSILLIDSDLKKTNDRTWSFWDNCSTTFNTIISKQWNTALFKNDSWSKNLNLSPYTYNTIQGINFYNFVFDVIAKHNNITVINDWVVHIEEQHSVCLVTTKTNHYSCNKLFNSILNVNVVQQQIKYPLLQQHFIGWFIKTEVPAFNANVATFMDFSVSQKGNTRFMYVLPTSATEALVEYTLFSKDELSTQEYETEIQNYIANMGINNYSITNKERGNIPMTCYKFWENNTANILNIGAAGGWTKASTGFTFKNTVKNSKKLVAFLQHNNDFRKFKIQDKFWYYDLLFIDVLYANNALGANVFSALFENGKTHLILKFLDGETSFKEDLQVMFKCPTLPFLNALFKRIFN